MVGRYKSNNPLLEYSDRSQLRDWLEKNHVTEKEFWVVGNQKAEV